MPAVFRPKASRNRNLQWHQPFLLRLQIPPANLGASLNINTIRITHAANIQLLPLAVSPTVHHHRAAIATHAAFILAATTAGSRGVRARGTTTARGDEGAEAADEVLKRGVADEEGTVGREAGGDDGAARFDVRPDKLAGRVRIAIYVGAAGYQVVALVDEVEAQRGCYAATVFPR